MLQFPVKAKYILASNGFYCLNEEMEPKKILRQCIILIILRSMERFLMDIIMTKAVSFGKLVYGTDHRSEGAGKRRQRCKSLLDGCYGKQSGKTQRLSTGTLYG